MKFSGRTRRQLTIRRAARGRRLEAASVRPTAMRRHNRDDAMPAEPIRLRRWEAAETHRLNAAQWQHAYGRTINEDLLERLETLRIRCEAQIARDPIAEGVVATFANDVVGPNGPRVQVESDSEEYNAAVEESIEEYHERPDPTRDQSLADTLRVDIRALFSAGEYLHQYTNARRRGSFEFAIRSIHARRLETPGNQAGNPNVFMGIEFDATGHIVKYWFRDEQPGMLGRAMPKWKAVDAQNIQHKFFAYEPDQLRGFPWFAVSLGDMGDRIQLNKFVMEASKNAAAQGIYWYSDDQLARMEFKVVHESREIEPGMEQMGPPGYKPFALTPTQPGAQWREFDHEKLRGYGRPIGMPLMMVLLSSEGNSFSGANHDGQIYIRTVASVQSWLGCGTLAPQYNQIGTETAIARGIRVPRRVRYTMTWVKPPHPDQKKNYETLRMQLEDGSASLKDVCAALDRDFESVQEARAYVQERLQELKLPPPPVNRGGNKQGPKPTGDENPNGETDGSPTAKDERAALQPA